MTLPYQCFSNTIKMSKTSKQRTCKDCNKTMLSSSYNRHLRTKQHLNTASTNILPPNRRDSSSLSLDLVRSELLYAIQNIQETKAQVERSFDGLETHLLNICSIVETQRQSISVSELQSENLKLKQILQAAQQEITSTMNKYFVDDNVSQNSNFSVMDTVAETATNVKDEPIIKQEVE